MNGVFKTLLPFNTIDNALKLAYKIPWSHQIEFFLKTKCLQPIKCHSNLTYEWMISLQK